MALHAQPTEIQHTEGPVQAPRPKLPARPADESFAQVYSGDDAASPGQMEGHASSSAGSVQHSISTAEMQRFQDEPGFSLPRTVGVEPERSSIVSNQSDIVCLRGPGQVTSLELSSLSPLFPCPICTFQCVLRMPTLSGVAERGISEVAATPDIVSRYRESIRQAYLQNT